MDELRRRARLVYLDGAEERLQRDLGRGLTSDELVGVVPRFPGR